MDPLRQYLSVKYVVEVGDVTDGEAEDLDLREFLVRR